MSYTERADGPGLGFISFGDVIDLGKWAVGEFGPSGSVQHWTALVGRPSCPGEPSAREGQALLRAAPRSLQEELIGTGRYVNRASYTMPTLEEALSDPRAMEVHITSAAGGSDCAVSSEAGIPYNEAWERIKRGGFGGTGAGGDGSILDRIGWARVGELLDLLGVDTTEAAVQVYESLPPDQQRDIERRLIGERVRGAAISAGPLALAAAGAALVFLVTRKT